MERIEDVAAADPSDAATLGVADDLIGYHLRRASAVFASNFEQVLGCSGMRQVLFGIEGRLPSVLK